jgi:hypothetical protein
MASGGTDILQFAGSRGRVKLVDQVELDGEQHTVLVVVLSHSIAIVDAASNELLKTYDFKVDDHSYIHDAVYAVSIRSFIVSFRDGTLALIPPNCEDPKLLPRTKLEEPLVALAVVGQDVVVGWATNGTVCEVPVYAGRLPETPAGAASAAGSSSKKSKAKHDAAECSRIGCLVRNVGVISMDTSQTSAEGISYDLVRYTAHSSENLLASRPALRWLPCEKRSIALRDVFGDDVSAASWRVVSVCIDPLTPGAALLLLSSVQAGAEGESSKKKSKGNDATAADAGASKHYLLKIDTASNAVLMRRELTPPAAAEAPAESGKKAQKRLRAASSNEVREPVHLLQGGGVLWLVWSDGLCEAYSPRYGVPVLLPGQACTEVGVGANPSTSPSAHRAGTCLLPAVCESAVLNGSSSGSQACVVSLDAEAYAADRNSFLFCALCHRTGEGTAGTSLGLWTRAVSLFDGSATSGSANGGTSGVSASDWARQAAFRPASLSAALGSQMGIPAAAGEAADVSGGVLALLSRACRRRLQAAQSQSELDDAAAYTAAVTGSDAAAVTDVTGVDGIDGADAAPTDAPTATATPGKKHKKASEAGTPAKESVQPQSVADRALADKPYAYIGVGKARSATRSYLDANMDAVEAFVQHLDTVLASDGDGVACMRSSDWGVLQVCGGSCCSCSSSLCVLLCVVGNYPMMPNFADF